MSLSVILMALLVISRHAMAFLLGWEIMALSAFFLVATEDTRDASRRAGWIYLVATHVGTLMLFGLFALWRWGTGSYALLPVGREVLSLGMLNAMFCLALLGFGLKAGLMPLHFWLPSAHANAPSHVSAMLSGVVLKMGIYGLVRFLSLLPDPPHVWGGLILLLGAVSGLLGVVFAIGQHDLKRLLAYHSVENIGIILMGLDRAILPAARRVERWFGWFRRFQQGMTQRYVLYILIAVMCVAFGDGTPARKLPERSDYDKFVDESCGYCGAGP
jgi:hydrogenase-4 component B